MKILKLSPALTKKLLRTRRVHDREAHRVAERIVADVQKRGDAALASWTQKFDRIDLRKQGIWVAPDKFQSARHSVTAEFLIAIEHAIRNVRRVALKQLPQPWTIEVERGVSISQEVRPLESVGSYIPGGKFALVSTMIMTVVPAQVAGVKNIVVVCPKPSPELLAAANLLGINRIAAVGGAQAIAALAYGTRSIPKVDKIVGPGNRFVTAAKQLISSDCAIDLPAGPTEAIVLAAAGNPRWIAADLLAQAEHAPDAVSLFVTTSAPLALQVQSQIKIQLATFPKSNAAHLSIAKSGAIVLADSLDAACEFVNQFAPEHLSLSDSLSDSPSEKNSLLQKIHAAGTIFLGPWGAQPFGDYASGSNHVLPTAGWARARGGLSAADFVKCISVQTIDQRGFTALASDVITLANAEGLTAHANAVEVRR